MTPRLRGFARDLRHEATPHEDLLWQLLRDRRFVGFKFRRQVPIGGYIADFACHTAKLIVELDGGQHSENARDLVRDEVLRAHGFHTLRIWNHDLTANRTAVLDAIFHALSPS